MTEDAHHAKEDVSSVMYVRMVPHWKLQSYLDAGWEWTPAFLGTHHGFYSSLCYWPKHKGEKPVEPTSEEKK